MQLSTNSYSWMDWSKSMRSIHTEPRLINTIALRSQWGAPMLPPTTLTKDHANPWPSSTCPAAAVTADSQFPHLSPVHNGCQWLRDYHWALFRQIHTIYYLTTVSIFLHSTRRRGYLPSPTCLLRGIAYLIFNPDDAKIGNQLLLPHDQSSIIRTGKQRHHLHTNQSRSDQTITRFIQKRCL